MEEKEEQTLCKSVTRHPITTAPIKLEGQRERSSGVRVELT